MSEQVRSGLVQHPRCPYCHGAVAPAEPKAACDRCMSWHHQECWDTLGRCAACQAEAPVGARADPPRALREERSSGRGAKSKPKAKGDLSTLPDWLHVEPEGGSLIFRRRWYQPMVLFFAFFCLFWDGFLVVWYGIVFTLLAEGATPAVVMAVLPLIHVVVGVGLTYFTICGFLNRTEVRLEGSRLVVQHRPLPWRGAVDLPLSELEGLAAREHFSRGKHGPTRTYRLVAVRRGEGARREVAILTDFTQEQEVEAARAILEERLGLAG